MSDDGNLGRNAGIVGATLGVITTAGLVAAKGVAVRDRRRTGTSKRAATVAAALADPSDARHRYLTMRDGAKVHVVERGSAAKGTVILLHGVTLSTRLWHYALDTLGDEFRTIAVDFRGHGRSRPWLRA
jgi:alpha/beta hydrolase fold